MRENIVSKRLIKSKFKLNLIKKIKKIKKKMIKMNNFCNKSLNNQSKNKPYS